MKVRIRVALPVAIGFTPFLEAFAGLLAWFPPSRWQANGAIGYLPSA
jgi:hypothetical protein